MKRRIPFDSLCLAASLHEVRPFLGSLVRRLLPLSDTEVGLGLAHRGAEAWILISADAVFARLHLMKARPTKGTSSGDFVRLARGRLEGARLQFADQFGADRIANLGFATKDGVLTLVAELMGKHSNLILVDSEAKIVACLKPVGTSKSRRPVLVGRSYEPPPIPLVKGSSADDFIGASPFLGKLTEADPRAFGGVGRVLQGELEPVSCRGFGAYPIPVGGLGYEEARSRSFSEALESELSALESATRLEQAKRTLTGQIERVLLARQAALHDLGLAKDTAARARELQIMGELVLAYSSIIEPGQHCLEVMDYEGKPVQVPLATDLSPQENAQRYFGKAKRAKLGAAGVNERIALLSAEAADLERALGDLHDARTLARISEIGELALSRKWLNRVEATGVAKEQPKPAFDGYRIRILEGPRGFKVLFGENATSNDYLTSRVAKPNDYWLHVRGATSAHVVIQTLNQPNRVGPDVIRFAAEIAHKNSSAKHSRHVAVDYTLKKYVRKPRGSAVGTAVYTHEKTIYVGE